MGDSPTFDSRFSTPVNELDDHRFQSELPRADGSARRGTFGSIAEHRPPLLQVNGQLPEGTTSRDFEHAVEESLSDSALPLQQTLDGVSPRRGSVSPMNTRRGTIRRGRNPELSPRKSGESLKRDDSPSPPNSVDAFAEPKRRPRKGTVGTIDSVHTATLSPLQKQTSHSTFTRPRKFSGDQPTPAKDDVESDQGSVEDDVCFPAQDEPSAVGDIDFEDLEEFVEKTQGEVPPTQPSRRKRSFSCRSQPPRRRSTKDESKQSESEVDDSASDMDEKKMFKAQSNRPAEVTNRWSFFSSELEDSIHAPDLGDLLIPGESFQQLFELGPEGGCWWLDVLCPTEDEVEVLCKAFGIHGLTREDIITQETREKVELFKQYYFVCFRSFFQMDVTADNYLDPLNVYAVVFREGIITFTFDPSPHAANVRKRMGRLRDYVALGSDWICYALIDDIVDTFGPVIHSVETETETIEDQVFTARPEDSRTVLRQIGECRKKVMSLTRLLGGKADVIKGFSKRCNENFSIAPRSDVGLYLSDIQDHVVTMMSNLGHFDHMLSRSHANYLAQISVDNIQQGNRANEVLSKVTFIATILVPLNLVCGLFGMNVEVPWKNSTSLGPFFGILGGLVTFVVICFGLAKKLKYI